ncbi:MAG TPA: type II toxin-antitoxin system HicB family antitoxin [Patescibacteria group bacterium]
MNSIQLQCVVWKEGRYFVAQCLNTDVSSFGTTEKKALANLKEALELYFEDAKTNKLTRVEKPELANLSIQYA